MRILFGAFLGVLCLVLMPSIVVAAEEKPAIDFSHDVLPLLKAHCVKCHGGSRSEGDLSINTREALLKSNAIVPGDSSKSDFIERLTIDDPEMRMPLEAEPLSSEQVAILRRWIDEGVKWEEGFSFAIKKQTLPLEIKRPELPPARDGREHQIDRLVDDYFAKHNAPFPPPVDDATFARRVYLDLIGLLPTPQQLETFLADSSPNKRERLVDEILANDRAYAEHWFSFWCDLLRNDFQGTGYIDGGRKQITGWLYRSLLENKPFNEFVHELISPTEESEGFIRGIKWRGAVNASQTVELQFAQNIGQVFLGINLKCASCHDSFIDDQWKLSHSYSLAAITGEKPLEVFRCDIPTGETAAPAFVFPELGTVDASQPRAARLEQLANLITDRRNGWLTRTLANRLWHRLMGRGIVHPVDAMAGEPWSVDLLEYLASETIEKDYDIKQLLRLIATSKIYQSRAAEPADPAGSISENDPVFRGPIARRMTAEQFIDAIWRMTGTAPAKTASKEFGERGDEPVRASLVASDLLMRSLGRPNRDLVVSTRPEDLSTLQALDLTNGPAMTGLLARGARNIVQMHPNRPAGETVDWLYEAALSRKPAESERATGVEILGRSPTEDSTADLLWCVFGLPEFQLIK